MSTQTTQVTQSKPVNANVNGAETLEQKIARLEAQITTLEAQQQAGISYKCYGAGETYTDGQGKQQTGKGVMSLSGLGKFPVSLYDSQWQRLIAEVKSGNLEKHLTGFRSAGKLAQKGTK